jgi:hypothetical protein
MRKLTSLLVSGLALAAVTAAVASTSTTVRRCNSSDLRYPFQPGGAKTFGVFRLRVAGGRCRTAHAVAHDWMRRFEKNLQGGHLRLPKSIDGFSFTNLPVRAAQTYRERGRRRTTTVWFNYVVPNG